MRVIAVLLAMGSLSVAQSRSWMPPFGEEQRRLGWRLGTFESGAAGARVGYYVFLPPEYESAPGKRYPVVYWLHGLGGSPASAKPVVERLSRAIEEGRVPPFLLVSCTDPTRRSMWTNFEDGTVLIETVIVRDLVPHIDATYRTVPRRDARAIEGFSMGGYGAAYLGFKYPELFGSVSILSGAMHTPQSLRALRREIFDAVYGSGSDTGYADEHTPWSVVRDNAEAIRGRTAVRLHVGADDDLVARNEDYRALLDELHIRYEWSIVPDTPHDLRLLLDSWDGDPFAFYSKSFSPAGVSVR